MVLISLPVYDVLGDARDDFTFVWVCWFWICCLLVICFDFTCLYAVVGRLTYTCWVGAVSLDLSCEFCWLGCCGLLFLLFWFYWCGWFAVGCCLLLADLGYVFRVFGWLVFVLFALFGFVLICLLGLAICYWLLCLLLELFMSLIVGCVWYCLGFVVWFDCFCCLVDGVGCLFTAFACRGAIVWF